MDTRRDGITTWVATFAKNQFYFLLVCMYSVSYVYTEYMYDYLLELVQMTKKSGKIDQATHLPSIQMEFERAFSRTNTVFGIELSVLYTYLSYVDLNTQDNVVTEFSCHIVLSSQ